MIIYTFIPPSLQTLLLCVIISPKEARRIQLTEAPGSVDQFITVLKDRLHLESDFKLQYEDPDFANALCLLTDMSELPKGRAVLHIAWNTDVSPTNESDSTSIGSVSSLFHSEESNEVQRSPTPGSVRGNLSESPPSPSSSAVQSSAESPQAPLRRTTRWPDPFPIPKFAYEFELRLRKGNEIFEKTQKRLILTGDIRSDIVKKLGEYF